jgi:RHS repeat-associated protein
VPRQRLTYNPSTSNCAQRPGEPWIDQRTQNNIRFTFSGKERDEETGYNYFGARYYNADISIWLSVDPMASERAWLTPYNYVQNNPLKLIDPTGMLDEPPTKPGKHNGDIHYDHDTGTKFKWNSEHDTWYGTDWNLDAVDVIGTSNTNSSNAWGGDHSGWIRSSPENLYRRNPVHAFLLDLSAWGLNNLSPLGAIDDAFVIANSTDASGLEIFNAAANALLSGAGRGPKRPPSTLKAFPNAEIVKPKTPIQGGGGKRHRWEDKKNIYEWDYKKGEVEIFRQSDGQHLGGYDPVTGKQISKQKNTRKTVR